MASWFRLSLLLLALTGQASAEPAPESRAQYAARICRLVEQEAKANAIDPSFFALILARESLFDPNVTSPKGAQGIAQFMPGTAAARGLANPFDAEAAVKAAASYLAELKKTFGNNGLAAAAYNGGEARVARWLEDKVNLAPETRSYVALVTGHAAQEWKDPKADFPSPTLGKKPQFQDNCVAVASRKKRLDEPRAGLTIASVKSAPWGALLAVNFDEDQAVAMFQRLKLRFPKSFDDRQPFIVRKANLSRGSARMTFVMLAEANQKSAAKTCATLNAQGAPCIVRKN